MGNGKIVKQVNNLKIRETELYGFSVWSPDGRCLEDGFKTLEDAVKCCNGIKDFVIDKK